MKGKSVTTSFLPKKKKGGKVRFSDKVTYTPDRERTCLTKDQTKHIYEMVEMNKPVNINAINQDIRIRCRFLILLVILKESCNLWNSTLV